MKSIGFLVVPIANGWPTSGFVEILLAAGGLLVLARHWSNYKSSYA
jgi:hypothetical protein